jgi:hypothetical protein
VEAPEGPRRHELRRAAREVLQGGRGRPWRATGARWDGH